MTQHPDRLTLDRASVGDLGTAAARDVEQHLADCSECGDYLAGLEQDRRDRLVGVSPEQFMASLGSRRAAEIRRQRQRARIGGLAGLGGLAAVAAAVVVMVQPTPATDSLRDPQFKSGNAPGVIVHRKRADTVEVIGADEGISPGDGLRVELSLPHRARVSARLEAGATHLDLAGDSSGLVLEAGTHPLPGSAVVSAPCADLLLVVEIEGSVVRRLLRCE